MPQGISLLLFFIPTHSNKFHLKQKFLLPLKTDTVNKVSEAVQSSIKKHTNSQILWSKVNTVCSVLFMHHDAVKLCIQNE